ncbi:MAG: HEAT repeat domain-containing protein [Planctomycetes bacterium]|nr:HEAT repeat domain-containing protein [Planctomycetota bacterium]
MRRRVALGAAGGAAVLVLAAGWLFLRNGEGPGEASRAEFDVHLRAARAAHEAGDFERALSSLDRAAKLPFDQTEVEVLRAEMERERELARAIEEVHGLIEARSPEKDREAWGRLATLLAANPENFALAAARREILVRLVPLTLRTGSSSLPVRLVSDAGAIDLGQTPLESVPLVPPGSGEMCLEMLVEGTWYSVPLVPARESGPDSPFREIVLEIDAALLPEWAPVETETGGRASVARRPVTVGEYREYLARISTGPPGTWTRGLPPRGASDSDPVEGLDRFQAWLFALSHGARLPTFEELSSAIPGTASLAEWTASDDPEGLALVRGGEARSPSLPSEGVAFRLCRDAGDGKDAALTRVRALLESPSAAEVAQAMADPDPRVRYAAVHLARRLGEPEALLAAHRLLGDPEPAVRRAALETALSIELAARLPYLQEVDRHLTTGESVFNLTATELYGASVLPANFLFLFASSQKIPEVPWHFFHTGYYRPAFDPDEFGPFLTSLRPLAAANPDHLKVLVQMAEFSDLVEEEGRFVPRAGEPPVSQGLVAFFYRGFSFDAPGAVAIQALPGFEVLAGPVRPDLDGPFSARWSGYVEVPVAGPWRFDAEADDGVRIRVAGEEALAAWAAGTLGLRQGRPIELAAGRHPIQIEFFDERRPARFHLLWARGDAPPDLLPASALSHRRAWDDIEGFQREE